MSKQIFVNLPVKDLPRSKSFFDALGFEFNPQFTNDQAASMIVSDDIFVMLLVEPFFQSFTKKAIADARTTVEAIICLSCDSRAEVDTLVAKALAAGGSVPDPAQDHGFMYAHSFEDLDGHHWELVHMSGTPPQA